jgi:hypothetical protein
MKLKKLVILVQLTEKYFATFPPIAKAQDLNQPKPSTEKNER